MRCFTVSSLVLFMLLGAGGCGSDPPIEPLADIQYRVNCGTRMGCVGQTRDINGFNNEAGTIVECTSGSGAAGATLNFTLSAIDAVTGRRFGVEVTNVIYDAASGVVLGNSGHVTVSEGSNTYTGAISAAAPSTPMPCQLTNVAKTSDTVGNPQIEGDLLCGGVPGDTMGLIGLQQSGVPTELRDLTTPTSGTTPAHFRIVLCSGLPIPG